MTVIKLREGLFDDVSFLKIIFCQFVFKNSPVSGSLACFSDYYGVLIFWGKLGHFL